jgi:sugar-specific transcriptional regulator TrmB
MERRPRHPREVPDTFDTSLLLALADFHLSEAEARAYLSLLARGCPCPLAAIARGAGLPRSTAHSALRALVKRGLIFCEGRYPSAYRAAPVSRLSTLAARLLERARRAASSAALLARVFHD